MILAAIDIGSNAARLLISEAKPYDKNQIDFTKLNLVRVPLQLGFDVFETGYISQDKIKMLKETIKAFKLLMEIYGVKHYRACATSAMRDAHNAAKIVEEINQEIGVNIEIITGQEEASILYETHIAENLADDKSYLYIDVGGGSTEFTLFANKKLIFKESFNLGTIRLLKFKLIQKDWDQVKFFLKSNLKNYHPLQVIGSGGNINKVHSMSKRKDGKPLKYNYLNELKKELSKLSIQERMHTFQLREDRAAVIVPALEIYTQLMRWAETDEIYVPKIGLADGVIKKLYQSYN